MLRFCVSGHQQELWTLHKELALLLLEIPVSCLFLSSKYLGSCIVSIYWDDSIPHKWWQSPSVVVHNITSVYAFPSRASPQSHVHVLRNDNSILILILPSAEYETLHEGYWTYLWHVFCGELTWDRVTQVTNEHSSVRRSLHLRGAAFFLKRKKKISKGVSQRSRCPHPTDHGVLSRQNTVDDLVLILIFRITPFL